MVKVFEGTDTEYYMDAMLKEALDTAKEKITQDRDFVFLVDGYERDGKSTLAIQLAYYCDQTLTLDRVVFRAKDFEKAIDNAKQYQAIVYDEGFTGLRIETVPDRRVPAKGAGRSEIPDVVGDHRVTAPVGGGLEHHVVFRVSQARAPKEVGSLMDCRGA
jgi:hypothetical protein